MLPVESILQFEVHVFFFGAGGVGGFGAGLYTAEMETAPAQSVAWSSPTWNVAFVDGVDSVMVPSMPLLSHVVTCQV